jgi:hypothetical protein
MLGRIDGVSGHIFGLVRSSVCPVSNGMARVFCGSRRSARYVLGFIEGGLRGFFGFIEQTNTSLQTGTGSASVGANCDNGGCEEVTLKEIGLVCSINVERQLR